MLIFLQLSFLVLGRAHFELLTAPYDVSSTSRTSNYHEALIAIKQRNVDLLESELFKVSDPLSPTFQHHWSMEKVGEFISNPNSTDAISAHLCNAGFTITFQSLYGEYLKANGTVEQWNALLNTTIHEYKHSATQEVIFRTLEGVSYSIPAELTDHIEAIFNVEHSFALINHHGSTFAKRNNRNPILQDEIHRQLSYDYLNDQVTPKLLKKKYELADSHLKGLSNITQCIYSSLDQYFGKQDIALFRQQFAMSPLKSNEILDPYKRDKIVQCQYSSSNCDETSLDLQYMGAIAPGAKLINWFDKNNNDLFVSWIEEVTSSSAIPSVISISYGIPEAQIIRSSSAMRLVMQFDTEAMKLGLRGVTLLAASGDHGSMGILYAGHSQPDCSDDVVWPASSPYVTAVGATMGPEKGTHTNMQEVTCSVANGADITTGGGFSRIYPTRPSWQATVVDEYLAKYSKSPAKKFAGRAVPDISALGNGYIVFIGGLMYSMSGTSASAPVVGGLVSLVNAARSMVNKGTIGWINPVLYKMGAKNTSATYYNDVTLGQNNNFWNGSHVKVCGSIGWNASSGWDATTGLGSPKFVPWRSYMINSSALSEAPGIQSDSSSLFDAQNVVFIVIGVSVGGTLLVYTLRSLYMRSTIEIGGAEGVIPMVTAEPQLVPIAQPAHRYADLRPLPEALAEFDVRQGSAPEIVVAFAVKIQQ